MALAEVAKENRLTAVQKAIGRCNISLLSTRQIIFATQKSGNTFDPAVVAGELLEATDCSPLTPVTAKISSINFKRFSEGRLRLVAFMTSAVIENETSAAHSLLSEQGLTEYLYLSGVHMSFGALERGLDLRAQRHFLNELSDKYVGTDIDLQPAALREYDGVSTTYTNLADIAINSIPTLLELHQQSGLGRDYDLSA